MGLVLADVFQALTGERPRAAEQVSISSVTVDSRTVTPGALFVALQGERQDGHAYIREALARGAVAIMAEARAREQGLGGSLTLIDVAGLQPNPAPGPAEGPVLFVTRSSLGALQRLAGFWRAQFRELRVVGITGSIGKSSTKELVFAVLRRRYRTLRSQGNLNNEIGLPLTLLQLEAQHERAVLEMGMYAPGEIRTLCELARPVVGIVTMVAPVHLERLGTVERIAQAKAELVQALPREGVAILNGDDPRVRAMAGLAGARVMWYGLESSYDLWADEIESHGLNGISFVLHDGRRRLHLKLPLLGSHSVHNALAAAAAGVVEGLDWEEIVAGLQDSEAQLRLLAVPGAGGVTLLDDTYNASPASTLAALNLLQSLSGRKVAVLGDMLELGPAEAQGHELVGARAAEAAQVVVAVGPRGRLIGQAAQTAGCAEVHWAEDNAAAVTVLRQLLQPGDLVLVKGSRGMRMEEIVGALAASPSSSGT